MVKKSFYAVYLLATCEESRGHLETDGLVVALAIAEGIYR